MFIGRTPTIDNGGGLIGFHYANTQYMSLGLYNSTIANSKVLTIDSNRNVGIRTTNPAYTLDVNGSGDFSTFITSGALYSTNQTTINIVTTTLSAGTLVGTTVSATNVYGSLGTISNFVGTTLSSSNLISTNVTVTNLFMRGDITFNTIGGNINFINIQDNQALRFGANGAAKTHVLVVSDNFGAIPGRVSMRYSGYVSFDYVDGVSFTSENMRLTTAGNLGIGTINPTTTLDVNGTGRISTSLTTGALFSTNQTTTNIVTTTISMGTLRGTTGTIGSFAVTGALSKGSGTFDIEHPTQPTKRLVHSFIEGPRCDLIYRGKVKLVNGTMTVNLDTDCVAEPDCAMTLGTFEALCRNPQYFLQNHTSFTRIRGSISGNILTIISEDINSTDEIYWTVIAERNDQYIYTWNRTNINGYLKCEH